MMKRSNVFLIIGNHEFMMYTILKKLTVEITSENCENYLDADDILKFNLWLQNGGYTTLKQFSKLSRDEKEDILDYIGDFSYYETINYNNKEYVLVHADLGNYSPYIKLGDYGLDEIIDTEQIIQKDTFKTLINI